MSATMNTSGQHEIHPDAESLSAFAEYALAGQERNAMLQHLAVCGRCRQVVALAREAAEAEIAAPAAQTTAIDPRAWWRKWRLVWVPAAVAAAFGALVISVHLWQGAQNLKVAEVSTKNGEQKQEMASTARERVEAQLASPSAATAEKEMKPAPIPRNPRSRQAEAKAAVPPPPAAPATFGAMKGLEMARAEATPAPAPETEWKLGEGFLAGDTPTVYRTPAAAEQQEGRKRQEAKKQPLAASAALGPLFAAKAAPPGSGRGADNGALASSARVVESSDLHEMRATPLASFGAMKVGQPDDAIAEAARAAHLPSGLAAVSTATAGPRMLAVDGEGTLFLSEDAGQTWQRISQQWTGRAVTVRRQRAGTGGSATAPETAVAGILAPANRQPEGSATGADGAASPAVVFEILNDKGQAWVSRDGRFWIPE